MIDATCSRRVRTNAVSGFIVSCLLVLSVSFAAAEDGCTGSETRGGAQGADAVPRKPWTASRLTTSPLPPEPFRIIPAFPGLKFNHPTSVHEIPGTSRMLVAEIGGRILTFDTAADVFQVDEVLNLAAVAGGNVSVFSIVLHPDFERNGFLYVCSVRPEGGSHSRVSRFTVNRGEIPSIDPAGEQVILTWPSGGHNAGCLRFGPDGFLYISTGDGSGPNPPDGLTTGQDVSDLLGAILRIDVDRPDGNHPYSVPPGNPFIAMAEARSEIFAYGLRNPWKFAVDRESGSVFVADNGWETWELIYKVEAGTNCGWPVMEGRAKLRTEVPIGPAPITPPIIDHHHSEANSVIGGPVYRGHHIPSLHGHFIYGDYITGTIWSVSQNEDGSFAGRTLVDTDLRIVDFLETQAGDVLVVDYDLTGQIYRLVPSDVPDTSAEFPRMLSETGVFRSLDPLLPETGVVPYDVIVPRWTDGAVARRFVAVPGHGRISPAAHSGEQGEYPEGTVFVKHLAIPDADGRPCRPLETQMLLFHNGVWNAFSYLWNDDCTDAELVGPAGAGKTLLWPDPRHPDGPTERTWQVSAVNECRLCHNSGPGFVLGFVGNQLAVSAAGGDPETARDQLDVLAAKHVITAAPTAARSDVHRLVSPADSTHTLNDRARSWLHGNCSMCHHKGGNAIVSFFLTRDLTFDQLNTSKGTGIGTFGMNDARIIAPGDPYRSVLMYRISKLGYARMPYIGSRVVDAAGVELIDAWIRSLPPDPERSVSPPIDPSSPQSLSLAALLAPAGTADGVRQSVRELTSTTEGALALVSLLHKGGVSESLRESATETVRNASSDVRGLFDDFIPESARRKTLGRTFEPQVVLSLEGDALRGRLIFFSDAARCRVCHDLAEPGLSVGPTLGEISRRYNHDSELLQHIMEPSLKIDDKYAAWTLTTISGRSISGLIVDQTDTEVTLLAADKQKVTVPRHEIEEMQRSSRSLMPDGILTDLTAEEAADLLKFIRSLHFPADMP